MAYLKSLLLLVLVVGISSCSSTGSKRKVIVPEGEPEWLYSPQSGCEESKELCASGEGANFKESDAHAKKSLASIFATKINSKFQFTKHSFSQDEITEMSEMVNNSIDTSVSELLKASFIKERFNKDKLNFSLAALDKSKSSKILKQEMRRIDDEMMHYYKQKNRIYIKKLNILFNQREMLNEKLTIVTNSPRKSPITFSQIQMIKYKSVGGAKVKIKLVNDVPVLLEKKFEELLTDVGYKLEKKGDIDFELIFSFKEKEEYLNVRGFKKFSFEVNIESKSNKGKRLGGYIINVISDGRTRKDAFAKVRKKILTGIEHNLEKLNLK